MAFLIPCLLASLPLCLSFPAPSRPFQEISRFEYDLRDGGVAVMRDGDGDIFTPRLSAIARVAPDNFSVGLPLGSRTTSMSSQRTPRAQPVPRAFIAASFAAKRPAKRSARLRCFSQ